jgi:hypothetical protein
MRLTWAFRWAICWRRLALWRIRRRSEKVLRSYLRAEGSDKYWVVYSLTEVEASEHDGDVIVATSMDGKPLGANGELKLISTADKKPERWVRNLAAIVLKSAE